MTPSLLLIPDRYKASKLYSQIPDSGAGDLAFTRANDTATRVNSAGLIEKVRTNLYTYSNGFTNAAWSKVGGVTITGGQADPDGGTNAFLYERTLAFDYISQAITSGVYTISVTAKANASNFLRIAGSLGGDVVFNLATGVVASASSATGVIQSLGNGWYRCSAYITTATTTHFIQNFPVNNGTSGAGSIYIYEAQAETGDIATDYIPTTTAAVSVGPVANIPRIDYTGGGCGKLLLEPQRTNLVTFSEQMNNAVWTKRNSTISANSATSPDGYTNADKIQEDTANDRHDIYQGFSVTSGTAYTISAFVKAAERTFCFLSFGSATINADNAFFNLSTGAVVSSPVGVTSTITSYGNGWYRITSTATAVGTGLAYVVNGPTLNASGISYQGVSGSGILVYGYSFEAGSYPTSYIPTLGASVTRSADAASKTGISSLIGTEFTIFYDGFETIGGQSTRYLVLKGTGGTYANAVFIEGSSANTLALTVLDNASATVFNSVSPSLTNGQRIKVAVRCKDNDFAFYVNGSLVSAQASGSVPTTADLYLGYYVDFADNYSLPTTAAIYTSGLSNAELATLTSL